MQNNSTNDSDELHTENENTVLNNKPSIMQRIFKKLGNNGVSLTIKTLFTALSILAVMSGGGIILVTIAALSTTILISAIGKTLVDAQVLKMNDKLNTLDQSIEKFADAKQKYDNLPEDKKGQIKTFLETNKDDPLGKILSGEKTEEANIKTNNKLATFDKVNNSVRSVLQVTKLVLMLPYILFNSVKLISTGLKTLMKGQAAVVGIKTIRKSEDREKIVKVEDKINAINQKIKDNNIGLNEPTEISKQAARLDIIVEICSTGNALTLEEVNKKLQEKNTIQYKKMSGAEVFFKSLSQNSKGYTDIIKPLEEIKGEILSKLTKDELARSTQQEVTGKQIKL